MVFLTLSLTIVDVCPANSCSRSCSCGWHILIGLVGVRQEYVPGIFIEFSSYPCRSSYATDRRQQMQQIKRRIGIDTKIHTNSLRSTRRNRCDKHMDPRYDDPQWVLARSAKERTVGPAELRQKYFVLKQKKRREWLNANNYGYVVDLFACDWCGEPTDNFCDGADCKSDICNDCNVLRGYCRACKKKRIPRDNGPLEVLAWIHGEACDFCGKFAACSTCGKCRNARYCSRDCQKADWKTKHKKECIAPDTKVKARHREAHKV
jgi:hypothetical protein